MHWAVYSSKDMLLSPALPLSFEMPVFLSVDWLPEVCSDVNARIRFLSLQLERLGWWELSDVVSCSPTSSEASASAAWPHAGYAGWRALGGGGVSNVEG